MVRFQRGQEAKKAMNIGRRKDAVIIVGLGRDYIDTKRGKHVHSDWSQEDLDPILTDLSNCILPAMKMPHKEDEKFKVHDMTFHIILPDGNRDDLRPLLLSGHSVVWKDKLYAIPEPGDPRWEQARWVPKPPLIYP